MKFCRENDEYTDKTGAFVPIRQISAGLLKTARGCGIIYVKYKRKGDFYENESCMEGARFLTLRIFTGGNKMEKTITVREELTENDKIPYTVEILNDPTDPQLLKLENEFKKCIGEEPFDGEKQKLLQRAVEEGKITFFVAKQGGRAVGMCSVAGSFSTFSCSDTGVFEDFYVEPAFRGKGIARKLAEAAQAWCRDNGIPSLTVCCAPCDEKMYQALGFDECLGTTFAHIG